MVFQKGHRLGMTGKRHSEKTKKKISKARMGQAPWNKNKQLGPLSKERRNQLSKYSINLDFFKKWTSEMAWALGIIVADGSIVIKGRESHTLQLSMKDKEVLEKIKKAMESTHSIKQYNHRDGRSIWCLYISRKEICEDLMQLGITPRKSLTIKFPNVPKEYLSHFLRGVLDGDGSIYTTNTTTSITAALYTGSKSFAEGLMERIKIAGFSAHLYPMKYKPRRYWRVLCWDKKFLPWLYKDKENYFLGRKFQKWRNLKKG